MTFYITFSRFLRDIRIAQYFTNFAKNNAYYLTRKVLDNLYINSNFLLV